MTALYIKDRRVGELAERLAKRLRVTKTQLVREMLETKAREIGDEPHIKPSTDAGARWLAYRQANPLPPATGEKADKAFFDAYWVEQGMDINE